MTRISERPGTHGNWFNALIKTFTEIVCNVDFAADGHIKSLCPLPFFLVCFLCLKESTCETSKNVFYFISKVLFILKIIKF